MVTKKKITNNKEETKSRTKVGKLQLNRQTVKDLTTGEQKQVKGGAGNQVTTTCPPC